MKVEKTIDWSVTVLPSTEKVTNKLRASMAGFGTFKAWRSTPILGDWVKDKDDLIFGFVLKIGNLKMGNNPDWFGVLIGYRYSEPYKGQNERIEFVPTEDVIIINRMGFAIDDSCLYALWLDAHQTQAA